MCVPVLVYCYACVLLLRYDAINRTEQRVIISNKKSPTKQQCRTRRAAERHVNQNKIDSVESEEESKKDG